MKFNYCPEHGDLIVNLKDDFWDRSHRCRQAHTLEDIHAANASEAVVRPLSESEQAALERWLEEKQEN